LLVASPGLSRIKNAASAAFSVFTRVLNKRAKQVSNENIKDLEGKIEAGKADLADIK
jgi:hypothetical protein